MNRTVTGTIRLRVRGESVEMKLSVPEEAVSLQKMLPVFQIMTDHFVSAAAAAEAANGRTVACGPRCDACCRQLIPLAETEAVQIAELVTRMPAARQSAVRARFAALLARLADEDVLAGLYDRSQMDRAALHALGMRYLSLQADCPFLEDKNCSIHEDRPLACREHLVTSSPECCARPSADSIEKVPMPASVFGAVVNLQRKERSSAAPFVPLPLALEWRGGRDAKFRGTEWLRRVIEELSGKKDARSE